MCEDKIAVIFIGIQASGKTTFYKNIFREFVHINLDELHTRNKENLLLSECIENGVSFVVDNTNPTKTDREKYILAAKEHGYKIKGYYFRSSIRESIGRNSFRERRARITGSVHIARYVYGSASGRQVIYEPDKKDL